MTQLNFVPNDLVPVLKDAALKYASMSPGDFDVSGVLLVSSTKLRATGLIDTATWARIPANDSVRVVRLPNGDLEASVLIPGLHVGKKNPASSISNWIVASILVIGVGSASIAYTLQQREHSQVMNSVQQGAARANVQLPTTTERMPDGTTRYTRCDGSGWCVSSAHLVDMEPTPPPAEGAGLNDLPRGFHTANPEAWKTR